MHMPAAIVFYSPKRGRNLIVIFVDPSTNRARLPRRCALTNVKVAVRCYSSLPLGDEVSCLSRVRTALASASCSLGVALTFTP